MSNALYAKHRLPDRALPRFNLGFNNLIRLCEAIIGPAILTLTIWSVSYAYEGAVTGAYFILSLLVFSLTFPCRARLGESALRSSIDILITYLGIAALLLVLGYTTDALQLFKQEALITLLWLAPLLLVAGHLAFRWLVPTLAALPGSRRKSIVIGLNEQGAELAGNIKGCPYENTELLGFFDDRTEERFASGNWNVLGKLSDVAEFVKQHNIQLIYISLPMASQARIVNVLDALQDTTASIYFVPDLFITNIIQGQVDHVNHMPVVSVCETPFTGFSRVAKRASDIILSLIILVLISPILIAIAVAIKLTSPGPILFKQRRYGLDGQEILVYKFRSMTVCDDGDTIRQAQQNDSRLTPIGGFIRRTSLDELPQFFNVLQGCMSIVGPRPHAVAHNEMYRKLIKGYMIRHKAKPGITGWAQVNGLRGETETLEKMSARIKYDLDYLRHWSVGLDIRIILMTVGVVFKDQNAY